MGVAMVALPFLKFKNLSLKFKQCRGYRNEVSTFHRPTCDQCCITKPVCVRWFSKHLHWVYVQRRSTRRWRNL